jgi:hypothetical protein
LLFLEFLANAQGAGNIIALGDASSRQNSLAVVPRDLVIDRVYIHGDPAIGQKRGIALNSASTAVINSHISDIKAIGQDAQAIAGWNGPGPYLIANNYLEAAGENILFGGADPAIPNLVPSDITIARNHVAKPLAWRTQQWTVKNLFELKSAQRVVVDGNLFEHNWLAAQAGYAILLKSVNQDGMAPWSVVQHVRFTNNIVRHVANAINILGHDTAHPAVEANNITIRNNVFDDVSSTRYGGAGRFLLINGGMDITVDHNTIMNDGSTTVFADVNISPGFVFTNNILRDNGGGAVKGTAVAAGSATMTRFFPDGLIFGNIFAGANAGSYPAGNFFPGSLAAVGFLDLAGGDLRLSSASLYKRGATDGSDPGCDIDALTAAIGGVPTGAPVPMPLPPVPPGPSVPAPPSGPTPAPSPAPPPAGVPGPPQGLRAIANGSTVTISWAPPASGGPATAYLIEAGTAPGAMNAAKVNTGSPTTSLVAQSVPLGVYYLRVKAVNASGISSPSAEVAVAVGTAQACASAPQAPRNLVSSVTGSLLTLSWSPPAGGCTPTQYLLLAGSSRGQSNLAQISLGTQLSLTANAPRGTYYVRVVAVNAGGPGLASNEVVVTVR